RVGAERDPGGARELEGARHRALLGCGEDHLAPHVRSRTPGLTVGVAACSTGDGGGPHLRALPIRTFTVGPGVSPGQPVVGYGRGAGFHRRLGITPTPEHASS